MSNFTEFPIPAIAPNLVPIASSVAQDDHMNVTTAVGVRRLPVLNTPFARWYVSSTAPSGTRSSNDFWINTSGGAPKLLRWGGASWVDVTPIPEVAELLAALDLGSAAQLDAGVNSGDVPVLQSGGFLALAQIPTIVNSKLSQMAQNTIKGRVSSGTGEPEDLSATQLQSLLSLGTAAQANTGTAVGNVPLIQSGGKIAAVIDPSFLNNVVYVNSISDFPAPSGGVITLAANTTYLLGAVNITALVDGNPVRFVLSEGTVVTGIDPINSVLTYSGADNLFTATNVNAVLCSFLANIPNGSLISFTSINRTLCLTHVSMSGGTVGTANGGETIKVYDCEWRNIVNGLAISGEWDTVRVNRNLIETDVGTTGAILDFIGTGTAEIFDIDIFENKFVTDTITAIRVAEPLIVTDEAYLVNNRFRGTATFIDGVNFSTAKWYLRSNTGSEDTRMTAHMWMNGNTTATTISAIDEWVKIGIATSANSLAGFTHTSPNTLTYLRAQPKSVKIVASLDVESSSNNQVCQVAVFRNGSLVAATAREIELNTQNISKSITINSRIEIGINDVLELYIRNRTSITNFTVKSLAVTV